MVRFTSLLTLVGALLASSTLVASQVSNDDPRGKVLYVNYPSCDSWKCKVTWRQGSRQYVNWVHPPSGKLSISLVPEENAAGQQGLPTYTLTRSIDGLHHSDKCDNMGLEGIQCGRFWWNVPANATPGEYTIVVQSLDHRKYVGYTDTVVIKKAKKMSKRHAGHRLDEEEEEEEE